MDNVMKMYQQYKKDCPGQGSPRLPTEDKVVSFHECTDTAAEPHQQPMQPVYSSQEPQQQNKKKQHTTEISQSLCSASYQNGIPTLQSHTDGERPYIQPYNPPARPATADTVGSPRKAIHRKGRIRKTTQGITPPSWFMPLLCLFSGLVFAIVGVTLTILGFAVKTFPYHLTKFFQTGGPIFLSIGVLALILGYFYFTIINGRHIGGTRKDNGRDDSESVTETDGTWGNKQRPPEKNEQAVMLFQTEEAKAQRLQAISGSNKQYDTKCQHGNNKTRDNNPPTIPESIKETAEGCDSFNSDTNRESTRQLISASRLDSLPVGRARRLPPLNHTLPNVKRDSNKKKKRKKNIGEDEGYVWREEDFDPMPSAPKDPSVFVVGNPSQNATDTKNKQGMKKY